MCLNCILQKIKIVSDFNTSVFKLIINFKTINKCSLKLEQKLSDNKKKKKNQQRNNLKKWKDKEKQKMKDIKMR